MENTCSELLGYCLRGEAWPGDLLGLALEIGEGRAFLSIVVERLGDLFEPRLCEVYRALFTDAIARVCPDLIARVRNDFSSRQAPERSERVYVLSRITLGADVAVTSVLLDAAKRRYPEAEIYFVAPRKNYELFEADPRIRYFEAPYARAGSLMERLKASAALWLDDGLVIDPDSRLTQLGLIRICEDSRYFFFNSRAYGGDGHGRLPDLAARWAGEIFGVADARPYIAPVAPSGPPADVTVSLGVGENHAKRIGHDFERELLRMLAQTGASVMVDKGGSPEEKQRVERVLPPGMRAHDGPFAPFAAQVARSRLFIGYDSAAGHVASACGIPLISIAKGFASERMQSRWRPKGNIIHADGIEALEQIGKLLPACPWPLAPGP